MDIYSIDFETPGIRKALKLFFQVTVIPFGATKQKANLSVRKLWFSRKKGTYLGMNHHLRPNKQLYAMCIKECYE